MRHTVKLEKQSIDGDMALYTMHHRFFLLGFIPVYSYHQFVATK